MKRKNNITKGYVWLLAILIVVIIISSFAIYDFNKQAYKLTLQKQEESMDDISEFITRNYRRKINDMFEILNGVAVMMGKEIQRDQNEKTMIEELKQVQSQNQFLRMGYVYANGIAYTTDEVERDLSDRQFFKTSIKGERYLSNIVNIELGEGKHLLFSVPIEEEEKVIGVLYGWYDSTRFIEEMDFAKDSSLYFLVVDSNGNFVSKSQNENVMAKEETNFWEALQNNNYVEHDEVEKVKADMKNGERGSFQFQNKENIRYVNYERLGRNGWYIISILVDADATSSTKLFYSLALELLLKIIFGFLMLGIFLYIYQGYSSRVIRNKNEQLEMQNHILNLTLENTKDIPFELNMEEKKIIFFKNTLYKSHGEYESFSADVDELIQRGFLAECSREDAKTFLEQVYANKRRVEQVLCVYVEGKERWIKAKIIDGDAKRKQNVKIGVIMDFMEQKSQEKELQKKELEFKQLAEESSFDFLTKIWNRKKFEEEVNGYLQEITEDELQAFCIIDIDHFKEVNDTLGHSMGDLVLQDVAKILRNHVREYDFVACLGGDEFVVLLKRLRIKENIEKIAPYLNTRLERVYEKDGQQVKISASIGVAFYPIDGSSFKDLYKRADIALYHTKENGRNGYTIYTKELEL